MIPIGPHSPWPSRSRRRWKFWPIYPHNLPLLVAMWPPQNVGALSLAVCKHIYRYVYTKEYNKTGARIPVAVLGHIHHRLHHLWVGMPRNPEQRHHTLPDWNRNQRSAR